MPGVYGLCCGGLVLVEGQRGCNATCWAWQFSTCYCLGILLPGFFFKQWEGVMGLEARAHCPFAGVFRKSCWMVVTALCCFLRALGAEGRCYVTEWLLGQTYEAACSG
jgi:hypothetical protein